MAPSPLGKFKILIADADKYLAAISRDMLMGMGFRDIQRTASGRDALRLIKGGGFDFLITDWHLKDLDGISLIRHIRRDSDSPNPTLPVIMLTARMELADVKAARDIGTHEYVVKPFSAQAIYDRLERIVEFPRYFVIGKEFVGPDRRNRQLAIQTTDRRKKAVLPKRKPFESARSIHESDEPQLWMPDMALKHKLGRTVKLESIITPAILAQAQANIDSATDESLGWIKEDLEELVSLCAMLQRSRTDPNLVSEICEIALSISARAGTFGYTRGAEVAYGLYLFLRNKIKAQMESHHTVIAKHLEVLKLILGTGIRNDEGDILLVMRGLKDLTLKYAP